MSTAITEKQKQQLHDALLAAGYSAINSSGYVRYSRPERGDSAFISHTGQVIRAPHNTKADEIFRGLLGEPNGKAGGDHQKDRFASWFLGGYTGKGSTKID